ncbi:MAG: hypothetical protein Q8J61_04440 [Sulfuricella sp.]|nr:hypothetical protein [Sulfuricella sp.]
MVKLSRTILIFLGLSALGGFSAFAAFGFVAKGAAAGFLAGDLTVCFAGGGVLIAAVGLAVLPAAGAAGAGLVLGLAFSVMARSKFKVTLLVTLARIDEAEFNIYSLYNLLVCATNIFTGLNMTFDGSSRPGF